MKKTKILVTLAAMAMPITVFAEGYQINTLSARQLGMASTGTALKLGTESQYFNPGALGFLDKTLDVSASLTAVKASAQAEIDGKIYKTDNKISTPLMAGAAFSIYDNFKAGITLYTPYGSSINWTDNWPGAVLNQSVDLKVFTVQPTFAWKPLPNLSVGAGLMITWGSVDLNKGLVSASSIDAVLAAQGAPTRFGNTTPASVNLNGTADVKLGVNLGVLWDINKQWSVGASWRSQQTMKVKAGNASITYANAMAENILQSLNVLNQANFSAAMPCPWVLSFGAAWKPIDKLTVTADARLTGWSAYKTLDIEFESEQLKPYDQHLTKNYSDAWSFSAGAEYALTRRLDLRAGLMIDTTPVNDSHYNPETPGMTKIEPAVGCSFRPIDRLSIDVAFMYVAGTGKTGSCNYTDLLAAQIPQLGMPVNKTFTADYKLHAIVPAIGLSFAF